MLKKGSLEELPTSIGVKLVPATYCLLMSISLVLLIVSIIQGFSWYKIIVLILLLVVSLYSGGVGRKGAFAYCKMNEIYPGNAIKKKKIMKIILPIWIKKT
jgi:hypothetical protein